MQRAGLVLCQPPPPSPSLPLPDVMSLSLSGSSCPPLEAERKQGGALGAGFGGEDDLDIIHKDTFLSSSSGGSTRVQNFDCFLSSEDQI